MTELGTKQWLNPAAFVSVVDPSTGACTGGNSVANCQFGDSGRNTLRGPHFTDSDIYLTKQFPMRDGITYRFDTQMFNAFKHSNFALPSASRLASLAASSPPALAPSRALSPHLPACSASASASAATVPRA